VTEWSEQWVLYLNAERERVAYGMHIGEGVEVVPKQEAEQKIEEAREKSAEYTARAVAAEQDLRRKVEAELEEFRRSASSNAVVDVIAENAALRTRADQALKQGAAEERQNTLREKGRAEHAERALDRARQGAAEERARLREKLKRLLDRAPSAPLAVLSQHPPDEGRVYALDPDDLLSAIDQEDSSER